MPLNFHIGLPGPFSYSTRVTPDIGKTVRQVNRVATGLAQRDKRRPQSTQLPTYREVPRYYEPAVVSKIPATPRLVRVAWVLAVVALLALAGVWMIAG